MRNSMMVLICLAGLAMGSVEAFADDDFEGEHHGGFGDHERGPRFRAIAPEIDPASAVSALTLLAGGIAVLRARGGKR